MTIRNSAAIITPGMGSSLPPVLNQTLALSGTTRQTNTLTPTLPSRSGIVNVKISAGIGTSPTVVALDITATDGTATEQVDAYNPAVAYALGANAVFHKTFRYLVDLNAASAGPGATTITVGTTLGGTSPGATLDLELCPDA